MFRSSRSNPAIAGFVILVLTCSQLVALGGQASQDQLTRHGESNQKSSAKKRTRKKKKKTRQTSFPLMNLITSIERPSSQPAINISSPSQETVTPNVTGPRQGTNRAARTPGVHITPVKPAGAPSFNATNGSPITVEAINPNPEQPIQPAIPYSSDIDVVGLTGVVTSVSVSINGLSHSNPDDLDMLLVAPNGLAFHFWSDVGGSTDVESLTVTVADNGVEALPDGPSLVSGTTYRPFNNEIQGDQDLDTDEFPVPAPGGPYNEPAAAGSATFTSVFAGMTGDQAGGTWQLFITDDKEGDGGSIANGWTLNITTEQPPTTAGQLIISEFRTKGPEGPTDEFVELYNTTGAPLIVQASDETQGLGVAASDGVVRCVVPNGTVIPKGGHFLCANGGAKKSLTRNPRSNTTNLVDQFYGLDIPDNAGIALFSSSASVSNSQSISTRLDAVGSTLEENSLYKEGTGYPAITANNLDHSFYRDMRPGGQPKDTGNNATDFLFVDTNATPTEAGQRLGSPGPQGLTDSRIANEAVVVTIGFPCRSVTEPPNRIRSQTPDQQGNSALGTMGVVKTVTNNSANDINTLRFRTFDITTAPAPSGSIADLRWLNSADLSLADVCSGEETVLARGITLDGPPRPLGGGFNTSGTVNLAQPLLPGETILVHFLWGVQQAGSFRVIVNIEILP
jgi:subtilisin-like proprotein convertase family protein